MDTTKPAIAPTTPELLCRQLGSTAAPLIVDVRKHQAFTDSEYMLAGALRRDPMQLTQWAPDLPAAQSVVVYCVHGHEVSQDTASALSHLGVNASYLEGGIEAWRAQQYPMLTKAAGGGTRWVTRERPKIDRIACPWLIRRFVDASAQFLYVPTDQVAQVAAREKAAAYDVAPNVASTPFSHVGERCSFDAFIERYHLEHDAALQRLALIVRGADTDRLELAPQCAGLVALSIGMSRIEPDDRAMLATMLPVYDALYAWCRDAVAGQDEKHNWKPV
jgi:rhodanese-related sulfurtransferase